MISKKPEEGIQELRYIDASKMRYVRQEMKSKEDKFKVNNLLSKDPTDYPFPKIEEYFIYNPKAAYPTGNIQARGNSVKESKWQEIPFHIAHLV